MMAALVFRGSPSATRVRSVLCHLDKVVVERCASADVRQRLRNRLIDIGAPGAELVPPDRKRNRDPGLNAARYSRRELALAPVVPDAHQVAIVDSAPPGVHGVELDEWLALALEERREVRERRVQERVRRRTDELERIPRREIRRRGR